MPDVDLGQDPVTYGSAAHPVRQDLTQYIVGVHWGGGAVHFDGSAGVTLDPSRIVGSPSTPRGIISLWCKFDNPVDSLDSGLQIVDYGKWANGVSGGVPDDVSYANPVFFSRSDGSLILQLTQYPSDDVFLAQRVSAFVTDPLPPLNQWQHLLLSWNSSLNLFQFAVNGVLVASDKSFFAVGAPDEMTPDVIPTALWGPPNTEIGLNTLQLLPNPRGFFFKGDMGPLYIAPDEFLDLSKPPVDMFSGPENIAKFINFALIGDPPVVTPTTPADLGAQGELPTNSVPAFYFRGGPATFLKNLGALQDGESVGHPLTSAMTSPKIP